MRTVVCFAQNDKVMFPVAWMSPRFFGFVRFAH